MYSTILCIDVFAQSSMLASPLHFSFLVTQNLSMSFLRFKVLFIVINFLVLWSIFLNSYLVLFKKGSEYQTTKTAHACIPLVRFLLKNLVSRSLLVLLRYYFLIFSFISFYLIVFVSNNSIISVDFFLQDFSCFCGSAVLFLPLILL